MKKSTLKVLAGSVLMGLLLGSTTALAADWRLAMPTGSGLAFVDLSTTGTSSVLLSGSEFGQVDDVISVDGGARLLAAISAIGSGQETILSYDTRLLKPTGTTSFGGAMFGIITDQTVVMPDGKSVVVVSFDGNVNQIDMATGKAVSKVVALEASPFGATLASDGSTLVVASREDGDSSTSLRIHTVGGSPLALVKTIELGKVKLSEDNEVKFKLQVAGKTAAVFAPGAAFLTDLTSGKVKKLSLVYNKKQLTPIGITGDGKTLLCRDNSGKYGIFVCDTSSGKVTKRVLMKDPAFAMSSSDNSRIYVASPEKQTLGIFDASMKPASSYIVEGLTGSMKVLSDPKASELPVPKAISGNIVIIGDALLGADGKDTFATGLAKQLSTDGFGIPVINACSTDAVAASISDELEGSIKDYSAAMTVITMGQADLTAAQTEAEGSLEEGVTKEAKAAAVADAQKKAAEGVGPVIDAAVAKATSAGMKVVLVCPPFDGLKPAYEAAAKKYNVPLIMGAKAFKGSLDAAYPTIKDMLTSIAK